MSTDPRQAFADWFTGDAATPLDDNADPMSPAEAFAEVINGPAEVTPEVVPPGPRLPKANRAQGTSNRGPQAPSPHAAFVDALEAVVYSRKPDTIPRNANAAEAGQYAGWVDLRTSHDHA